MKPSPALADTLAEMTRRIVKHLDPQRIILFGSHARGAAGADSDIDLLVVASAPQGKRNATRQVYRLLAGMGIPKDVIVVTPEEFERFRHVSGTIIQPAAEEGRRLYERPA